jgi:2'-5' RNA ligase
MVQSVELVLDEVLDQAVRDEWDLLAAAGLPSQARHTGASNAPHATLGVAHVFTPAAEDALTGIGYDLGGPVRLGGLVVFGGRASVLSRLVVPSDRLLRMHREVQVAMGGLPGRPPTTEVGRWTPHVTLARRLGPAELAAALAALAHRPRELAGTTRAVRRWDSDARRTWDVAGTS